MEFIYNSPDAMDEKIIAAVQHINPELDTEEKVLLWLHDQGNAMISNKLASLVNNHEFDKARANNVSPEDFQPPTA